MWKVLVTALSQYNQKNSHKWPFRTVTVNHNFVQTRRQRTVLSLCQQGSMMHCYLVSMDCTPRLWSLNIKYMTVCAWWIRGHWCVSATIPKMVKEQNEINTVVQVLLWMQIQGQERQKVAREVIQQSWGDGRGMVLEVKMALLLFLSQHTGRATILMVYIQYGVNKHATSKKAKTLKNQTSMPYSSEICESSRVISVTKEIM